MTIWNWEDRNRAGYNAVQTPAVDHNQVYFSVVNGIMIMDKANGTELPGNPPFGGSAVGEQMSPMLTAAGHVVGRDYFGSNTMIAIDRKTLTRAWTGRTGYPYQPVTAGNVIYAYHADNNATIDAISDTDGTVLWSWPVPKGETLGSYPDSPSIGPYENMVLTDNLLFVGTQKNIYAIDLATRQTVWSYPVRGQLVLSSSKMLYIFVRTFMQDSKVIAIKLT
jgi:outer membrane protein assembly factor BamB